MNEHNKVIKDHFLEFSRIASTILNKSILSINGKEYRITEIEFYLTNNTHQDPFTHKHRTQLMNKGWYLHRTKNSDTKKSGKHKGLDYTLGSVKESKHFGVLIRGIENLKNPKDYLDGPCKVVNKILEINKIEISKYQSCKEEDLKLELLTVEDRKDVFKHSHRVGLKAKHLNQLDFYFARYRFFTKIPKAGEHFAFPEKGTETSDKIHKKYNGYYEEGKKISREQAQMILSSKAVKNYLKLFGYYEKNIKRSP